MSKFQSKEFVPNSIKSGNHPTKQGNNGGSCHTCWTNEERKIQAIYKVKGKLLCIEHAHYQGVVVY